MIMASRSRSRSPIQRKSEEKCDDSETKSIGSSCEQNEQSLSNEVATNLQKNDVEASFSKRIMLCINNLPTTWSHEVIKNFIHRSVNFKKKVFVKFVNVKKIFISNKLRTMCAVTFDDEESMTEAYKQLNGMIVEGEKLEVETTNLKFGYYCKTKMMNCTNSENSIEIKNAPVHENCFKSKLIRRSPESQTETFGLSLQFLSSLGIAPPLYPRIMVSNLSPNITDEIIKEVFGMAGLILESAVLNKGPRIVAVVNYDHPIEAVQAVSMFNNHVLYGSKMHVTIDRSKRGYKLVLPAGLGGVGPGLGPAGDILRNARTHAALLELRQHVQALASEAPSQLPSQQSQPPSQPTSQPWQPNTQVTWNTGSTPNPAPQPLDTSSQIVNLLQTFIKQQTATPPAPQHNVAAPAPSSLGMPAANSMIQYPVNNKPFAAPQAMPQGPYPDNSPNKYGHNTANQDTMRYDYRDPARVEVSDKPSELIVIRYLPPYVTLEALKEKMSEVGKLAFAEITGHGKALLRFTTQRDADTCIRLFDRSSVDGQVIEVQYI